MLQRYVCIRQRDMMDCGAAALATVALHYRRPIGLEQMRALTGTDRAGTNLLGHAPGGRAAGLLRPRPSRGHYDAPAPGAAAGHRARHAPRKAWDTSSSCTGSRKSGRDRRRPGARGPAS